MGAKTIQIGGKAISMVAFASCNVYYKRIFREDPFVVQSQMQDNGGLGMSFAWQMGYIMARMAECECKRGKLNMLTEDDYLDWLEQFDTRDLLAAADSIIMLYMGQQSTSSTEKKEEN